MSSKNNLEIISEHKIKFQTEKMKVPVLFHASSQLLPNEQTFQQLENLAQDDRLFQHIAAMSDVHPKKGRKNPTGTVVASENYIFPQINDTAPNCGMRFLRTSFTTQNLKEKQIDQLFQELVKVIPTKKYIGTRLSYRMVLDIAKYGSRPWVEKFKPDIKNEIANTFEEANLMTRENITDRDLFDAIPKLFLRIAQFRSGILGAAGNHFLDLMRITEIKNPDIAQKFQLEKNQYIFLMHTGSGLLGQYASYMYTPKIKEHFSQKLMLELGKLFTFSSRYKKVYQKLARQIRAYQNKKEFWAYAEDSLEGKIFLTAHQASGNFGFINRTILSHHLDQAIKKTLKQSGELNLLYDMPHISNIKEEHYGKKVWIHRNGTSRAFGPQRMQAKHTLFGETGEPVFIPSSMSTPAYLGVGTDYNETSFFSASHGTGRRAQAQGVQSKEELFQKMQKQKVRLYNAKSKGVVLQDSAYYKDVEEVIAGMEDNQIVRPVVKMQPVAVLMY